MGRRETVSDVFLETLQDLGLSVLFSNLGTDYAPIVETLAKYRDMGRPLPDVVLCPHELTAITAAHGYALATGQGQGVFVHVGVGTQNLGGALHNAWTGRIPMLIFAGRSPVGTRGERPGSRDNPIHFYQDVRDQAGVIRQFCKWELNLEAPEQAAYAFHRAVRLMQSDPKGAVYLTAAREILGVPAGEMLSDSPDAIASPKLGALSDEATERLVERLREAKRPLLITQYAGREKAAVGALVEFCEAFQVPVIEQAPTHLSFPRTHPLHWGFFSAPAVTQADLILLADVDVPWLGKTGSPQRGTPIVQLDVDPLKQHIVMWDFAVTESHQVEVKDALHKLLKHARAQKPFGKAWRDGREDWSATHRPKAAKPEIGGKLTPQSLSALLGELLSDDTVIVDETVTSADSVWKYTRRTQPGTHFGSPGSSLGWGIGTALGHKLARPEQPLVCVTGDGSFVFGVPTSLYMTAARYRVPFLTVIYNNSGWAAVKMSTRRVYGQEGSAAKSGEYFHELGPTDNLHLVAAAFGCFAAKAETAEQFRAAFAQAQEAMEEGRPAVINAILSREGPEPM